MNHNFLSVTPGLYEAGIIPSQVDLLQTAVAGRYLIQEEIGRGGASIVFRARDLPHQRSVAIKVMRPEVALSPERFLREILIVAQLQHPNIVPLFDSGRAGDLLYYVMPFIEGETLRARMARRMSIEEAVDIARQVAHALGYAHARGLVHRDVKPENILLAGRHALLADFGVARAIARAMDSRSTGSGIAIGTPAYMSPEQAVGDAHSDHRSDQYSLACVVYEMLTGTGWHDASSPRATLRHGKLGTVPSLRTMRFDVPKPLESAIARALSPMSEDRFDTIEQFARALASGDRGESRRPTRVIAGVALVAGLFAGGVELARVISSPRSDLNGVPTLDPRHVAVLYFDDHSPDRSLGYLANGLTESLIHQLSIVGPITVTSRNGVKQFRDRAVSTDSIAAILKVGSIVEGSVQISNNRVRVTAQLIDGRTGTHIGSRTIEREMGELFLLEDDLAEQVSAELRQRIGVEVRRRERESATRSARARELVWRADGLREESDANAATRDTAGLRRSLALSARADAMLALAEQADPRWLAPIVARGWLALDRANRLPSAGRVAAFDKGLFHAARALKRDSTDAAARELRGTLLYRQAEVGSLDQLNASRALTRAESDLRQAISADSTLATAWGTLSRVRSAAGDVADAEKAATIALAMDAYLRDAPSILETLFGATLMSDSIAASWRWCERGAREYPREVGFVTCRLTLLAEDMSRPPDPRRATSLLAQAVALDPPPRAIARGKPWLPIYRQMMLSVVLARAGLTDSARAIAATARAGIGDDPVMRVDFKYEEALLESVLGNKPTALRLLTEYVDERPYLRGLVARHPRWKPLRDDARFQLLVQDARPTRRP